MSRHLQRDGNLLRQAAIGLAGGLLGGLAMNAFGRVVKRVNDGREAPGAAPGVDRDGRGVQPPQAEGRADEDAAVRVGTATYRAVTGRQPDKETQRWLGSAAHYGFSAALGVCYAIAADRAPLVRAGRGTLYGTLVWVVADEGIMPALSLSRGPRQLPAGVHAYALLGHLVFGATLDTVVRSSQHERTPAAPIRSS